MAKAASAPGQNPPLPRPRPQIPPADLRRPDRPGGHGPDADATPSPPAASPTPSCSPACAASARRRPRASSPGRSTTGRRQARADDRSVQDVRALPRHHRGPPHRRARARRRHAHRLDEMRELIDGCATPRRRRATRSTSSTKCTCCRRSAFNALLKTLEEPPPHVKFIFATTEIRKVPVTILSRCQRFDLRPLEPD